MVTAVQVLASWEVLVTLVAVQHMHMTPHLPIQISPGGRVLLALLLQVVLELPGGVWMVQGTAGGSIAFGRKQEGHTCDHP